MGKLLGYSVRSLWARRTQTLASLGAIALLVFVLSASRMLSAGMKKTIASTGSPDRALVMHRNASFEAFSRMTPTALVLARGAPGILLDADGEQMVTAEVVAYRLMTNIKNRQRVGTVLVRGVSDNVFVLRPEARIIEGRALRAATDEAIVGKGLVGYYEGLSVGGTLELSATRAVKVVGVFESGGSSFESEVWVDIETARSAFASDTTLSSVTARLQSPSLLDSFANPLLLDETKELSVQRESAYYQRASGGLSDVIFALGLAEATIFSLGAILGAAITMYASVAQRRREIGVLRVIGFSGLQVLWTFLVEAVVLSLAGALLGVVLALLTQWINFRAVNLATGQEVSFQFVPSVEILSVSVLAAVGVGLVAGILPAIKAARIDPIAAARA